MENVTNHHTREPHVYDLLNRQKLPKPFFCQQNRNCRKNLPRDSFEKRTREQHTRSVRLHSRTHTTRGFRERDTLARTDRQIYTHTPRAVAMTMRVALAVASTPVANSAARAAERRRKTSSSSSARGLPALNGGGRHPRGDHVRLDAIRDNTNSDSSSSNAQSEEYDDDEMMMMMTTNKKTTKKVSRPARKPKVSKTKMKNAILKDNPPGTSPERENSSSSSSSLSSRQTSTKDKKQLSSTSESSTKSSAAGTRERTATFARARRRRLR